MINQQRKGWTNDKFEKKWNQIPASWKLEKKKINCVNV